LAAQGLLSREQKEISARIRVASDQASCERHLPPVATGPAICLLRWAQLGALITRHFASETFTEGADHRNLEALRLSQDISERRRVASFGRGITEGTTLNGLDGDALGDVNGRVLS